MTATLAPEAPTRPAVQNVPLTALDRCDSCGAQAYIRVGTPKGGELLFCAHHANKHKTAMGKQGVIVITDETHKLYDPRSDGDMSGEVHA